MLPRSCWLLQLFCATAGFLGWLGLGTPPEELGTPPEVGKPPRIPLEMAAGAHLFQTEARCWVLSPLDSCHHQPPAPGAPMGAEPCGHPRCHWVVVRLRSSCANLSEEEEVNCQTSPEGHRTQPCTPDTEELRECLAGWLRPRHESPDHHSLQRPGPGETLVANEQHRVARFLEDTTQQMGRDLALLLAQMEEMMEKLQQVNRSLGLMLAAVEDARSSVENHPQHLHAVLDPAGAISTSILRGSCLVLLAVLLTPPRAILLLLLFFLASSTLSIPVLSALLVFTTAGQWLVAAARRGAGGPWLVFPQEEPSHRFTSTPDRERKMELLREELDRMEMSCLREPSCTKQPPAVAGDLPGLAEWVSPLPGSWRTKLSSCEALLEPDTGTGKRWEPKRGSPRQSLASGTSLLSPRSLCQGVTRAGQRCRKSVTPGQDFCHIHAAGPASCSRLPTDSSPHV